MCSEGRSPYNTISVLSRARDLHEEDNIITITAREPNDPTVTSLTSRVNLISVESDISHQNFSSFFHVMSASIHQLTGRRTNIWRTQINNKFIIEACLIYY